MTKPAARSAGLFGRFENWTVSSLSVKTRNSGASMAARGTPPRLITRVRPEGGAAGVAVSRLKRAGQLGVRAS